MRLKSEAEPVKPQIQRLAVKVWQAEQHKHKTKVKPFTMGYPVEIFTTPPPDGCICAICRDVLKDPTSFKEYCGHAYCDECAKPCLRSKACPICRNRVTDTVPNINMRDMIGVMEVKCPTQLEDNESNKRAKGNDGEVVPTLDGCGWVGKIESLHDHEKVCQFKLVTCDIEGCGHQCRRKDMTTHNISGDGLIRHVKLLRDSNKALKKKVSELEAKQSQEDEYEGVKIIEVEGCGTSEINGTYTKCDIYRGKPKFSKEGRWDGRDAEFKIYYHYGSKSWCIVVGAFWHRSCCSEIQFFVASYPKIVHLCTEPRAYMYRARIDTVLPPSDGWELIGGDEPPPRITVLGNDNE
jgi:hypothetical protein